MNVNNNYQITGNIVLVKLDNEILHYLSFFKRIHIKQLYRMLCSNDVSSKDIDARLKRLKHRQLVNIDEDGFVSKYSNVIPKFTPNEHKAFDIIVYFKDQIDGIYTGDYPFIILFTMNHNIFDVVVFEKNSPDETLLCNLINRSMSERLIAIVEDEEHIESLSITKNVRYAIVNDEGNVDFIDISNND